MFHEHFLSKQVAPRERDTTAASMVLWCRCLSRELSKVKGPEQKRFQRDSARETGFRSDQTMLTRTKSNSNQRTTEKKG